MFKGFAEKKAQLAELAEVLNQFKSEAAQVRLIELLFGDPDDPAATPVRRAAKKGRKKEQIRAPEPDASGSRKKRRSGDGANAILRRIFDSDFFTKSRTINDICQESANNYARRIKPNEISGALARMVRDNELSRKKNADGQFEYTK